MKLTRNLTMAVAITAVLSISHAHAQPGPAGSKSQSGTGGTRLVILGSTDAQRHNIDAAAYATSDCQTKFGAGARWANTKDIKTLAWDIGDALSAVGWVDIYPVAHLADERVIDISGWIGTPGQLACGIQNAAGTWIPHQSVTNAESALTAHYGSGLASAPCNAQRATICVGPKL